MDQCCEARGKEIEQACGAFGRVLWVGPVINAAMFVIEFGAELVAPMR